MNLASATDLNRWAELRDAQARLPQLVRRLILSTANDLTSISMRAGEGVQLPGWDGVVIAQSPDAHVPAGISVWEMGVNVDPAEKANEDYRKRTKDPGDVVLADTTFVFVTPRRWREKDAWVARKNREGRWKNVVAYDADDLETWLERVPEVHIWISSLLGKNTYEAENVETWWESWSNATRPALPPSLLLSGRDKTAKEIREFVQGSPAVLALSGDSQEEVVAVIASAFLQNLDAASSPEMRRALVVRTPNEWHHLAAFDHPLILIPLYEKPNVARATQRGHHVLIPLGKHVGANTETQIPRLRRDGVEAALIEAGLTRERASALATIGRRSLLSLRRAIAISREVQTPEWADPQHVRTIIPAVLVGTWRDDVPGDREAIAELAGRPYDEVAQGLTRWANSSDPPFRPVGHVWIVSDKQDAWTLTARSLTSDDISRFRQLALKVIGGDDPALDLAPRERVMASMLGKERPYSGHLIQGLADTLALMAATSEQVPLPNGRRGHDVAESIVRTLLEVANGDTSGRRWITLATVLPLLAEAAPDVFLRAVEAGLRGDNPVILKLFQDGDGFDSLFGSSPHPELLWALENLAWSPEYLGHAAWFLAKLTRLDPGGRLGNRPGRSLHEILILWRPGTAATLEQRLQVIDLLRKRESDVAWQLMLSLIQDIPQSADWPHSPTWRDWKPETEDGVTDAELNHAVESVAARALKDAGTNVRRWADLLSRIDTIPPSTRNEIIETLHELATKGLSSDEQATVLQALRDIIGRHREYPDADWALPQEDVDRLAETIPLFEPDDPIAKYSWLFAQGAAFSFEEDRGSHDQRRTALLVAQIEAVRGVYQSGGLTCILEWSERLEAPAGTNYLGHALGFVELKGDDENDMYNALMSEVDAHRQVAHAYTYQIAISHGTQWLEWAKTTSSARGNNCSPAHQARFLLALPSGPQVWELAEELGEEIDREYWQHIHLYSLPRRGDACVEAARKLIKYERPHIAIDILDFYADRTSSGPPHDVVVDALELAARTPYSAPLNNTFSRHVGNHLDRLAKAGVDEQRLAKLEWMYLPLFRYAKRHSHVLHRALASDPSFFVEIVSLAYRARGEEPRELSQEEAFRAQTAYHLLRAWRLVPGSRDDGTIDGTILQDWVTNARNLLSGCGRIEAGDEHIGQVLYHGPQAKGDEWPTEPIREIIEEVASEALETGFYIEVINNRGVTSRGLTDGGQQERTLVARYRRYATTAAIAWPRTAAMLNRIADSYEREARDNDIRADLNEDLWR